MDDMDIMAAMGISGFGKKSKQRQLDPKRFDKNKREEVRPDPVQMSQNHDTELPCLRRRR